MKEIFIDGSAGTTGLEILERLSGRDDITLVTLPDEVRKDVSARKEAINHADIAFLCLPDAAARESVGLLENDHTVIIDTSTAHRVDPRFTYGFPEIIGKEQVKNARLIANPGCHASGFIALVAPLAKAGIIPADVCYSATSLTGYSGGGKKMIAEYESPDRPEFFKGPRFYALGQQHKHLPEMKAYAGVDLDPVFNPIVADFYRGMEVIIPLDGRLVKGGMQAVKEAYAAFYTGEIVHYDEDPSEGGLMSAAAYAGCDDMEITVAGNEDRLNLIARYDNLGKGASGAAIQNLNLVLGAPEATGLKLRIR